MDDMCTDNRFELIERFKKKLIESTNIETSPEEMKAIDNLLFRFWQMGWLDIIDRMLLVKESAKILMHSVGNSVSAKAFRNAGRFIQNAIDGEAPEFEKIPPAQPEPSQVARDIATIIENEKDMRVIAQPEIIRCKDYKTDHGYMWLCPVCGLSNHSDFGECVRCGHKRPDAKPEPKKGKWIILKHSRDAMCSKCHRIFVDAYDLENWDNYCRHCGAVMESIVAEEEWNE